MVVMHTHHLDAFLPFCRELAEASGAIIRRYYRTQYTIDTKSDESPVTVADREAELAMRALIGARFPEHGVLGEEFGLHNPNASWRWVLDPIDGTKNFISHSFLFGTLIALLYEERPVLGAIHHPVTGDYLVGDGATTWLNGAPVRVRPCARVEDALLLTSSPSGVDGHQDATAYDALTRRVLRYRTWGDCHGYYLVATGGADIMLDPVMAPWDLMALIPIVEGAGGRITDWQGKDASASTSAVATAGMIHDEVICALNP
jgi:myo-inositol-1(or 4)-monophosphatase